MTRYTVALLVLFLVNISLQSYRKSHTHRYKHASVKSALINRSQVGNKHDAVVHEATGTKRDILESLEKEFPKDKREKITENFSKAIQKVLDISDKSGFDSMEGGLTDVLKVAAKNAGDLFNQMDVKMGVTPNPTYESGITDDKTFINDLVDGKEEVIKTNWIKLKEIKKKLLPQVSPMNAYSKDFFPDFATYILSFVGATTDLAFKGDVDKCQVSRELDLLKNDVATAVQALIYKRLSMLEPYKNSWSYISGNDKLNWKDKFNNNEPLCQGNGCVLNDGSGKPVVDEIEKISEKVLDDADHLFDVVDEVLAMVTVGGDLCFEGCDCPQADEAKIERNKYKKDFPWGCRGEIKHKKTKKEKECVLPCGKYGENYNWCPVELSIKSSGWDYCEPADWAECAIGWYK